MASSERVGRAVPRCVWTDADLASCVSFCRYYINLCQKIYKGPQDCSERASVCKKSPSGEVQVLGLVHTQKLDIVGKARAPSCGHTGRV